MKLDVGLPAFDALNDSTPDGCPDCSHPAVGLFPNRLESWLMRTFRAKGSQIQCATWRRDDGVGDVEQCSCRHISHASTRASRDDSVNEVEDF